MILTRDWRIPKLMLSFLLFELPLTIALLALFGIASPDLYRTKLWTEGARLGFNSDPQDLIYAAANHENTDPPVPWSSFITKWNLVISVFSMFIWLTKITLYMMHVLYPVLSTFIHAGLVGIYAYSVYGQSAPDNSDPKHATNGPCWYITKDCGVAGTASLQGYCKQAKSAFIVTCFMLALFSLQFLYAIWSSIPTQDEKIRQAAHRASRDQEKQEIRDLEAEIASDHQWELRNWPRTPGTAGGMRSPMTPRTMAFNQLGGDPGAGSHPGMPGMTMAAGAQRAMPGSSGTSGGAGTYNRELPLRDQSAGNSLRNV